MKSRQKIKLYKVIVCLQVIQNNVYSLLNNSRLELYISCKKQRYIEEKKDLENGTILGSASQLADKFIIRPSTSCLTAISVEHYSLPMKLAIFEISLISITIPPSILAITCSWIIPKFSQCRFIYCLSYTKMYILMLMNVLTRDLWTLHHICSIIGPSKGATTHSYIIVKLPQC